MKVLVDAKPSAKEELVEKLGEGHFRVAVKQPPVQGRANAAICNALADYLGISPARVNIVSGHMSRHKIIAID